MAAKKIGRPTDSRKDTEIRVRANPETMCKLDACSKELNTNHSEVVRKGIDKMYNDLKNERKRRFNCSEIVGKESSSIFELTHKSWTKFN